MSHIKKALKIALLSISMGTVGCVSNKVLPNIQTPSSNLNDKQIKDFGILASQISPARMVLKLKHESLLNDSTITDSEKTCLMDNLSQKGYQQFFINRAKLYLSTYPHRYEHDLHILNSKGTMLYAQMLDKSMSKSEFKKQLANQSPTNMYDFYAISKDSLNKSLRDLLFYPNKNNVFDKSHKESLALFLISAIKKCNINKMRIPN